MVSPLDQVQVPPAAVTDTFMVLQRALWLLPLLCGSAFFAGTETALFSLSLAQRESFATKAASGQTSASRVLFLLSNPRRLITTLILGNEVINISISSLVTGVVSRLFERLFGTVEEVVVAIAATVLTVPLLIFFGELVPKTIALKGAQSWAARAASFLVILTWALWIPRVLLSGISWAVTFPFIGRASKGHGSEGLREKEFRTLVDMGNAAGEIAGTERRLIHNVFEFGDRTVGEVMTKAEKVFSLSVDLPLSRIVDMVSRQRYSRVPVYKGRKDNVVGVLFAKDLVGYAHVHKRGERQEPLSALMHPPLFVPRRAKCDRLLREFQRRKTHMALVVDEYGKLSGLITMEDLLHVLVGDISEAADLGKAGPVDSGAHRLQKTQEQGPEEAPINVDPTSQAHSAESGTEGG